MGKGLKLFLFLFVFVIVSAGFGGASSCADNDGGINYFVPGFVKGVVGNSSYDYPDYCVGFLREFYCNNNSWNYTDYYCGEGYSCYNYGNYGAACIPLIQTPECFALSQQVKTKVHQIIWNEGSIVFLKEGEQVGYYNGSDTSYMKYLLVPEPKGGAILKLTELVMNSSDYNYDKISFTNVLTNQVIRAYPINSGYAIMDFYGYPYHVTYNSSYVFLTWSPIDKIDTFYCDFSKFCFDNDGGINYFVKGTLQNWLNVTFEDYCLDGNNLIERYCTPDPNNFTQQYYCPQGCSEGRCYICGDANSDGIVNINDAVYLINYIFSGGSAPKPVLAGDADGNTIINIGDAVYLINYVFGNGSAPCFALKSWSSKTYENWNKNTVNKYLADKQKTASSCSGLKKLLRMCASSKSLNINAQVVKGDVQMKCGWFSKLFGMCKTSS